MSSVKLISHIPRMTAELVPRLAEVVKNTAFRIEGRAKVNSPVDTGFLRNSITSRMVSKLQAQVEVGAEYGIHVEYGTYKMGAQPYLRPAVSWAKQGFEQDIMNVMRRMK